MQPKFKIYSKQTEKKSTKTTEQQYFNFKMTPNFETFSLLSAEYSNSQHHEYYH